MKFKRTATCGELAKNDIKKEVTLCGWVNSSRDHGNIIFIDLRDRYGLTQIVFDPEHDKKGHKEAETLRREDIIAVKGKVRARGKGLENHKLNTGEIEFLVDELEVLNKAETPPLEVNDRVELNEDVRLKYRYLDLRRPSMQNNILVRHKAVKYARDYFDDLAQRTQPKKTWVDIYCDDLEITDSTGQKSRIKVGENIYYAVDVDHSIFGWKYKRKEYFDVYVKKIFNPEKKNLFADALGFDFKKEPLCQAHFGEQDLIIYREDFQAYWLTEEHYNKLELKSGLATAFLVVLALVGGVYWLFATHPISAEQREDIKLTKLSAGAQITPKYKQTLIERYDATDGEINYIVTGQYLGCFKKIRKTKEFTEVRSAPDSYALVNGSIPKDTEVQILLYYEGHKAYKIKSDDLRGWVPERVLDNPDCTDEIK